MVTRSKTIPKLKDTKQGHRRQHKRRDDTGSDYRDSTLREGKTKFFLSRDKMAPVEGAWDRAFLWGFQGQAFPELPSCFIASSQLLWARITLLLCLLGVYKTFTQLPSSAKRDISGRPTFTIPSFSALTLAPWKTPEVSPIPQTPS